MYSEICPFKDIRWIYSMSFEIKEQRYRVLNDEKGETPVFYTKEWKLTTNKSCLNEVKTSVWLISFRFLGLSVTQMSLSDPLLLFQPSLFFHRVSLILPLPHSLSPSIFLPFSMSVCLPACLSVHPSVCYFFFLFLSLFLLSFITNSLTLVKVKWMDIINAKIQERWR